VSIKTVTVTGGTGQIAYSLLFRIARGELLGEKQQLRLAIYDLPEMQKALKGLEMELQDCAFPLVKEIVVTGNLNEAFEQSDYALLVGAKPRGPGMARSDLLAENGKIFVAQGKALNESASKDALVLVVGNPCNTNCLIAMSHAPRLARENFHAMTRLDQNRAKSLLARKAHVDVSEVTQVTIWGNHSSTQVPDFLNARIRGKSASEVIQDSHWLHTQFIEEVQNRGAAIIEARGKSSAASAASAAIDALRSLIAPTNSSDWFSSAVWSGNNPYGIEENLIFSFPCKSLGNGKYVIVEDLPWDEFMKEKILASEEELKSERHAVFDLAQTQI
jgi:malate dehydrogenase